MKIEEYRRISEKVQIPDRVMAGYQNAMEQIKVMNENNEERNNEERNNEERNNEERNNEERNNEQTVIYKWKSLHTLSRAAIIFGVLFLLSGSTILTGKAYISHLERMRNMEAAEVIDLYENVFQYDTSYMSRALSETEEKRYSELYDLYCRDMAEPLGEAAVISSRQDYKGKGVAFCTEDGILYIPQQEMSDEEILQMVVFNLLGQYVDYEAYIKASNPQYYMNYLEQMTMEQVNEIYISYYSANTETCFENRQLSIEELGRRKVLKMLYKNSGKLPEQSMPMIQKESEYNGEGIAFCISNCTYYYPDSELSDEQLLQLIDFQIKVDYCWQRIKDEIERGVRSDWPHIEYVERERIITLDGDRTVDETVLEQQWLKAYEGILQDYYKENTIYYENPERYYANVCFIYLNEDEVPEMLLNHGCTDMDYDDNCNKRNYLYTCNDGEAVLLTPGEATMDDFYGYDKPFSYVEGKGMVYCDYYYSYGFSTYDNETDIIDNVNDNMSRMDIWDLDTMTCTSSNANIEMLHAVYNYVKEEYADAAFREEYYVNVSEIIRDEATGNVKEIVGDKVDRQTYEAWEKALWQGEEIITLSVDDFDKIYADDNVAEALAMCYSKNKK